MSEQIPSQQPSYTTLEQMASVAMDEALGKMSIQQLQALVVEMKDSPRVAQSVFSAVNRRLSAIEEVQRGKRERNETLEQARQHLEDLSGKVQVPSDVPTSPSPGSSKPVEQRTTPVAPTETVAVAPSTPAPTSPVSSELPPSAVPAVTDTPTGQAEDLLQGPERISPVALEMARDEVMASFITGLLQMYPDQMEKAGITEQEEVKAVTRLLLSRADIPNCRLGLLCKVKSLADIDRLNIFFAQPKPIEADKKAAWFLAMVSQHHEAFLRKKFTGSNGRKRFEDLTVNELTQYLWYPLRGAGKLIKGVKDGTLEGAGIEQVAEAILPSAKESFEQARSDITLQKRILELDAGLQGREKGFLTFCEHYRTMTLHGLTADSLQNARKFFPLEDIPIFISALRALSVRIKDKNSPMRQYLLRFAHGRKQFEEVLDGSLDKSITIGDAMEIYALLNGLREDESGGYPKSLKDSADGTATFFLQIKIARMIGAANDWQGNRIKYFLFNNCAQGIVSGAANIDLPDGAIQYVRQALSPVAKGVFKRSVGWLWDWASEGVQEGAAVALEATPLELTVVGGGTVMTGVAAWKLYRYRNDWRFLRDVTTAAAAPDALTRRLVQAGLSPEHARTIVGTVSGSDVKYNEQRYPRALTERVSQPVGRVTTRGKAVRQIEYLLRDSGSGMTKDQLWKIAQQIDPVSSSLAYLLPQKVRAARELGRRCQQIESMPRRNPKEIEAFRKARQEFEQSARAFQRGFNEYCKMAHLPEARREAAVAAIGRPLMDQEWTQLQEAHAAKGLQEKYRILVGDIADLKPAEVKRRVEFADRMIRTGLAGEFDEAADAGRILWEASAEGASVAQSAKPRPVGGEGASALDGQPESVKQAATKQAVAAEGEPGAAARAADSGVEATGGATRAARQAERQWAKLLNERQWAKVLKNFKNVRVEDVDTLLKLAQEAGAIDLDAKTLALIRQSGKAKEIIAGAVQTTDVAEVGRALKAAKLAASLRIAGNAAGFAGDAFGLYMAYCDWQENGKKIAATSNPALKGLYSQMKIVYATEGTSSAVGIAVGSVVIVKAFVAGEGALAAFGASGGLVMLPIAAATISGKLIATQMYAVAETWQQNEQDWAKKHEGDLLNQLRALGPGRQSYWQGSGRTSLGGQAARKIRSWVTLNGDEYRQWQDEIFSQTESANAGARFQITRALLRRMTFLPRETNETDQQYAKRFDEHVMEQAKFVGFVSEGGFSAQMMPVYEQAQTFAEVQLLSKKLREQGATRMIRVQKRDAETGKESMVEFDLAKFDQLLKETATDRGTSISQRGKDGVSVLEVLMAFERGEKEQDLVQVGIMKELSAGSENSEHMTNTAMQHLLLRELRHSLALFESRLLSTNMVGWEWTGGEGKTRDNVRVIVQYHVRRLLRQEADRLCALSSQSVEEFDASVQQIKAYLEQDGSKFEAEFAGQQNKDLYQREASELRTQFAEEGQTTQQLLSMPWLAQHLYVIPPKGSVEQGVGRIEEPSQ